MSDAHPKMTHNATRERLGDACVYCELEEAWAATGRLEARLGEVCWERDEAQGLLASISACGVSNTADTIPEWVRDSIRTFLAGVPPNTPPVLEKRHCVKHHRYTPECEDCKDALFLQVMEETGGPPELKAVAEKMRRAVPPNTQDGLRVALAEIRTEANRCIGGRGPVSTWQLSFRLIYATASAALRGAPDGPYGTQEGSGDEAFKLLLGAVGRYLTLVRSGPDDAAYEALCELDRIAYAGRGVPIPKPAARAGAVERQEETDAL